MQSPQPSPSVSGLALLTRHHGSETRDSFPPPASSPLPSIVSDEFSPTGAASASNLSFESGNEATVSPTPSSAGAAGGERSVYNDASDSSSADEAALEALRRDIHTKEGQLLALKLEGSETAVFERQLQMLQKRYDELERHLLLTRHYWEHLGSWRADVVDVDTEGLGEEGAKITTRFAILVHCAAVRPTSPPSSLRPPLRQGSAVTSPPIPPATAAFTSSAVPASDEAKDKVQETEARDGWLVMRTWADLGELHQALLQSGCNVPRNLKAPPRPWRLSSKTTAEYHEKFKNMVQGYLNRILNDTRAQDSQSLFAFLCNSPDHLRLEHQRPGFSRRHRSRRGLSFSTANAGNPNLRDSGGIAAGNALPATPSRLMPDTDEDDLSAYLQRYSDKVAEPPQANPASGATRTSAAAENHTGALSSAEPSQPLSKTLSGRGASSASPSSKRNQSTGARVAVEDDEDDDDDDAGPDEEEEEEEVDDEEEGDYDEDDGDGDGEREAKEANVSVGGLSPLQRAVSAAAGNGDEGAEDGEEEDDEEEDDEARDSSAKPLYGLIGELFELEGVSQWFRRSLIGFVQLTYGQTINRTLASSVDFLFYDAQLLMYLNSLTDSLFPLQPPPHNIRDQASRQSTLVEAERSLLNSIPPVMASLVGQSNCRRGIQRLFNSLQNAHTNKHVLVCMLELLLVRLLPELSERILSGCFVPMDAVKRHEHALELALLFAAAQQRTLDSELSRGVADLQQSSSEGLND